MKSEVAVLADNKGPVICQLAVADNIQSFPGHYSTFRAILNWQFSLYYIHLLVCNITGSEDYPVAQGRQNSLQKRTFRGFPGR